MLCRVFIFRHFLSGSARDVNPVVMNLMNSAGVAAPPAEIKRVSLSYKYYPGQTDAVSYVIVPGR